LEYISRKPPFQTASKAGDKLVVLLDIDAVLGSEDLVALGEAY